MAATQLPPDVINDARSVDLVQLVESYGVSMAKQGKDYFACCPFHSEETPSFTVYQKGSGPHRYHCHGCGADGDAIQFVQDYEGLKFRDAVGRLVGTLPSTGNKPVPAAASTPAEPEEVWTPIMPAPESAPLTPDTIRRKIKGEWVSVRASRRWDYRNADGDILGYVFRFDMPGGGKEVLPLVWAASSFTGEMQWRWMSFPKPRPLYGLDKLAQYPNAQVLVVEGEKSADAAQELFLSLGIPLDRLIVISWPGGGKAVKHADFSSLAGRAVALWPDADQKPYTEKHERAGLIMPFLKQPGTVAMLDIWQAIRETALRVKFILPPANVPDGWDLADPLPPGFDLLEHIKRNSTDAGDVERRFSLVPSLSADDKIVPIWFVPATDPAELRRAVFAADVAAMFVPDLGDRIDPRGVQLRPFAGIDGLRAAISESRQLLPAAQLRVLLPAELDGEAIEVAKAGGAAIEVLQPGESWTAFLLRAAGLQELMPDDGDDDLAGTMRERVSVQMVDQAVPSLGPVGKSTVLDVHQLPPVPFGSWPHQNDKLLPLSTIPNLRHLLANYGVTARYDVIRKKLVIRHPGQSGTADNQNQVALNVILSLCALNRMPKTEAPAFMLNIGDEDPANPVMDFITSRPWDGRSRFGDLLATVETRDCFDRELFALLLRRWLISAVAAAAKPSGFWSKGVLVFQGDQSLGKTTWFRHLLPVEMRDFMWVDAAIDPANKDTVIRAASHWLVELGELDGTLRKADIARLKGFISQDVDTFRRPYSREDERFQRRTVFFASVNPSQFLADDTGNVRWWTVPVIGLNCEHGIDQQQLWAEVFEWFNAGERWWLEGAEEARLEARNADHQQSDPVEELLLSRRDFSLPATCRMTATELLIALGYEKPSRKQLTEASAIFKKHLGEPRKTNGRKVFDVHPPMIAPMY